MDNGTQRDRLITFIESKRMTRREFQDSIGVSISYVHNMSGSIRQPILSRIEETYPELNIDWLVSGKGEMINDRKKRVINQIKSDNEVAAMIGIESMIPLLPTSAMAGKLTDFSDGIDERSCELMIPPIRDAELAITVTGDSMSPEYPSGSKIILKKINESAFIDWGRTYVLDTIIAFLGFIEKYLPAMDNEGVEKYIDAITIPPFTEYAMSHIEEWRKTMQLREVVMNDNYVEILKNMGFEVK